MPVHSPYASVSATRDVLQKYGLDTKKALGQHFLINDGVVGRICDVAEVSGEDTVLEVGPGIGTLTATLLLRACSVVAVERDKDLVEVLADTCSGHEDTFALINKDALDIKASDLTWALSQKPTIVQMCSNLYPNKFVANLPYAVAATLVLDFFQKLESMQSATIMVQSEVADRMSAQPGTKNYGAYTVKLSLYAKAVSRFTVGPQNFFPPPRVDSAVIRLDRYELLDDQGRHIDAATRKATCIMADAAFATRRKTILNSCKTYFTMKDKTSTINKLPQMLEEAGIDPGCRGESLATDQFVRLGKAFAAQN